MSVLEIVICSTMLICAVIFIVANIIDKKVNKQKSSGKEETKRNEDLPQ